MKKISYILVLFPLLLNAQHHTSCPLDHHRVDVYENPLYELYLSKYDVKFYHLSLDVSNQDTYLDGFTTVLIEAVEDIDTLVFQLANTMEITSIDNSGDELEYSRAEDAVYILFDAKVGQEYSITIHYKGDAGQDRGFFAGISSAWDATNQQQVTYTLSEPLNARDWFPVKQVLTDKADSVWFDITCDTNLMAGSNGLLIETEDIGGGKHTFKWRSHYPIAYYLISFAVANYRDYSFNAPLTEENDSVLVQNFIYDDDGYFNNWKSRIDETGDMITLYSRLVINYPFKDEKYGHCVAPMSGGMEHQTMTTLSNFNFTLVAHELAHMWFGDNITCGSWQDIWINEGFASYFEYLALQNLRSQEEADNWMNSAMGLAKDETGSVYVPEEDADNVSRVFDYGLSYKKGAVLLHMIRHELNDDDLFFEVLKSYSEEYRSGLATANDFRETLDSISGMDFSCFFDQWYYGKGYPTFNISWYRKNDTLFIESQQTTSSNETQLFVMPFDISLRTDAGEQKIRLHQTQNDQIFTIPFEDYIWDIEFDPERHLLASWNVRQQLPDNKSFVLGPNPFSSSIILKFQYPTGEEKLDLINLEGKVVLQKSITSNPYKLDLSHLEDGPFLLVVYDGHGGKHQEKIVKVSGQ